MKKITKAIVSSFLAFAMIFAAAIPVFAVPGAAEPSKTEPAKTKVVIHKILMEKEALAKWAQNAEEQKPGHEKYTGDQIKDVEKYFGNGSKEIKDVRFRVYKEVPQGTQDSQLGSELITKWKIADSVAQANKFEAAKHYKEVETEGYLTTEKGAEVILEEGTYVVVEDRETSPYFNQESELTDAKAIPFKITLPLTAPSGTGYFSEDYPLHVYPKNTEDKPVTTKDFAKDDQKDQDRLKSFTVGDEIPYIVETTVPQNTHYKTMGWNDLMVEGLDFKTGTLVLKDDQGLNLQKGVDYELVESKRGFTVTLNETGLKKAEEQSATTAIKFTLTYKAELNETAKVDTNIPNKVEFRYGNRPNTFSEPKSGKPKDKEIEIKKTWAAGTTKVDVEFNVYEKETGKLVQTVELSQGQDSVKVKDLDNEKEYIVIEKDINQIIADYKSFENGVYTLENKKNPNPEPNRPLPPNAITHGKKFVKVDKANEDTKLAGAEFVVTNNDKSKFLALKSQATQQTDKEAYEKAQREYIQAVKDNQDVQTKKDARDKAFEKLNMQFEWIEAKDENLDKAYKLISDDKGEFEITGLGAGTYNLKEIKAPTGYALPTDPHTQFEVNKGTYTDAQGALKVQNTKVSIPQTGGMGTLIFTVVGITVMGVAVYAMRKRSSEER